MLLRFGTSNHRSIREYQEISFTASSLKDDEEGLLRIEFEEGEADETSASAKLKILPVLAIYGSNAAGKSTTLNALDFFVDTIKNSHGRTARKTGTLHKPFLLDADSRKSESSYDIDFVIGETRYHYGFKLDGKRFTSEWLYAFNLSSKRQVRTVLFHRDHTEDEEFYFGGALKGDNKRIVKSARDNSLYLSVAAQNAHPLLSNIYEYFFNKVSTRLEQNVNKVYMSKQLSNYFSENKSNREQAFSFLKAADIGVEDVNFTTMEFDENTKKLLNDVNQVISKHFDQEIENDDLVEAKLLHTGEDKLKYPIDLMHESSGTLALLQILGPVFTRLAKGGILIVDELNISLHPLVSKELVKLFSSPITNPGKAQLLFTTHDTGMLTNGLLRRDQIWFAEKSQSGSTRLYSLSDIKTRSTDNFEKGYIEGRFGAIPLFGIHKNFLRSDINQDKVDNEK
ncbi:AAA family ATPase [Pseudomonas gessardii]|uniref:AAA family ATPase n=1 Tax=Pseudomonas gessardii TaxID=78544 RepID=UPI0014752695|nr:ATP-binding protein [Pseudomonas gessardii]